MNKQFLVALVALVLVFGGFVYVLQNENKSSELTDGRIQVSASFYPMYFFTKEIGGDFVTVTNITPAGTEPHDYDPSTQDIATISGSKILVLNGTVEVWGEKVAKLVEGTGVGVVVAGEGLQKFSTLEEGVRINDPHIWLDPILAKVEVDRIAQALILVDPINAVSYQENREALLHRLESLHQKYTLGLSTCSSRDIITAHSAFAYVASRYNLKQVSISGLSPEQEPSAQELAAVANFAKANNVHYIFFESLVSPKLADTIAKEVGAKTLVLNPLEGITDEEAAAGSTYFSIMEENLKNLQIALQCQM